MSQARIWTGTATFTSGSSTPFGIYDSDSAIKKLDSGASLLQIYSSLVYEGPLFPSKLIKSIEYRNKSLL